MANPSYVMEEDELQYQRACKEAVANGLVKATYYRRGAVLTGWPSRYPNFGTSRPKRGKCRSASVRSLIRGAFRLSNCPVDFSLMTTLTFRTQHDKPKECLRTWCRMMVSMGIFGLHWGWWQELQDRGVWHYHVVHLLDDLVKASGAHTLAWEDFERPKGTATVLRGPTGRFMAEQWIAAVGDSHPDFLSFQHGGRTELIRTPEAISHYLVGEMAKAYQKTLPEDLDPQGRWWWFSPSCDPVPIDEDVAIDHYPFSSPHRLVFDARRLRALDQLPGSIHPV